MNEDVFNGSIRRFLKALGVSAQREIEKAVRHALAEGRLKGNEKIPAKDHGHARRDRLLTRDQRRDRTGVNKRPGGVRPVNPPLMLALASAATLSGKGYFRHWQTPSSVSYVIQMHYVVAAHAQ